MIILKPVIGFPKFCSSAKDSSRTIRSAQVVIVKIKAVFTKNLITQTAVYLVKVPLELEALRSSSKKT